MATRKNNPVTKLAGTLLLGLLVVSLLGFGVTNFGGNATSVGKVGKAEISVTSYANALDAELNDLARQTGSTVPLAMAQQFGVDRAVLDRLVNDAALDNEAMRIGLSVGDAAVSNQVLSIDAFRGLDGNFDRAAYEFALERSNLSAAEFEDGLRADTARSILQSAVSGGVRAPKVYATSVINWLGESRDISWLRLSAVATGDTPVPSEDALIAYHTENADEFTTQQVKKLTVVSLLPEDVAMGLTADEDQLQALYDSQLSEFVQPERRMVERLVMPDAAAADQAMADITAGTSSFDDLVTARGLTLDDIDLGALSASDLGAAGDAVFATAEPGVVGPVETDLGPALFRVNAILAAQNTTLDEVREDLAAIVLIDEARRVIADKIENLDDLLAGGATLEEIASEAGLEIRQMDFTDGDSEGLSAYEGFNAAATAAQVDDFVEIIELEDGGIFALRVDAVVEPFVKDLNSVREQVVKAVQDDAARSAAKDQAIALQTRVATGETLLDLARAEGVPLFTKNGVTRTDYLENLPPAFLKTLFAGALESLHVVEDHDAILLARVKAITPADTDDAGNQALASRVAGAMAQSLAEDVLAAYAAALRDSAGLELDQAVLNAVHAQFP